MISNLVTSTAKKHKKECQNFTKNALDESPSFVELQTLHILNIISNLNIALIYIITSGCFFSFFWYLIYKTECGIYLIEKLFIVKIFQF